MVSVRTWVILVLLSHRSLEEGDQRESSNRLHVREGDEGGLYSQEGHLTCFNYFRQNMVQQTHVYVVLYMIEQTYSAPQTGKGPHTPSAEEPDRLSPAAAAED